MTALQADTAIDSWVLLFLIGLIAVYAARSAVGVALWVAGGLPGRVGDLCSLSSQFVTPRLVRRACIAVLGIASSVGAVSASHAATTSSWADVSFSRGVVGASTQPLHPPLPQRQYTVKEGDCLWSIASSQLGVDATDKQVERQWHRWYQRNRDQIGSDPNVLIRGTALAIPAVRR